MKPTTTVDFFYLGRCLEGFSYGLYSGIFVMYLRYHASENGTGAKTKNILFYAICVLYLLSVVIIALDIAGSVDFGALNENTYHLTVSSFAIFGCCNFISQSILIYRCWIVWGRNIRVVIIPAILAIISLAACLSISGSFIFMQNQVFIFISDWGYILDLMSLVMSMSVNLLVTPLIVFRIFRVFREVKIASESGNFKETFGATGRSKLQYIIFVLIESGVTVFSIQFSRLLTAAYLKPDAVYGAWVFIVGVEKMLNGIMPTFILVRVSMGLSFHDQQSLEEVTASLHFAPDDLNPMPETESIDNMYQESNEDDIDVRPSNDSDIQMVER